MDENVHSTQKYLQGFWRVEWTALGSQKAAGKAIAQNKVQLDFFFPPSLVQVNLNNHMLLKLKWKQKVNFFPKENQQALYVLLLWIFFPVKPFCILHTWLQRKTDWSALGCAGNLTEYACIWGKHSCSLWPRMTRSVTTRDWLVHYRIIWHLSHVGLNRNCFFVLLIKCKVFSHHVCKGVWRS